MTDEPENTESTWEVGTLMDKIRDLLPANRIAAITATLIGLGTVIASLSTNFAPGSQGAEALAKAAAVVGGLTTVLYTINKFINGAQADEARQHELNVLELKGEVNTEAHDPEVGDVSFGNADEVAIDQGAEDIDKARDVKGTPPGMLPHE